MGIPRCGKGHAISGENAVAMFGGRVACAICRGERTRIRLKLAKSRRAETRPDRPSPDRYLGYIQVPLHDESDVILCLKAEGAELLQSLLRTAASHLALDEKREAFLIDRAITAAQKKQDRRDGDHGDAVMGPSGQAQPA